MTALKIVNPALEDRSERRLYIAQVIFLLGIFMKQFYLHHSGTLQIGDALMMAGCALYIFAVKRGRLAIREEHRWYIAFFISGLLVNSVYFVISREEDLLISSSYYLFNLIVILVFSEMLREKNRVLFARALGIVLKVSVAIQAALYFLGLGNWQGAQRYIGTFRDPNQFGIFIFFAMLMIYLCDHVTRNRWWPVWSLFAMITVMPSASTGTMLGIVVFWAGMYFSNFRSMKKVWRLVYGFLTALFILLFLIFGLGVVQLPDSITSHFMYVRIISKVEMLMGSGGLDTLLTDRIWDRVAEQPIYFIYGSGEGWNLRFEVRGYELHSSILGPAFAYGIVPFSFLLIWVVKIIRRSRYLFIYIAMFVEAMFVVNTRQPMFWMIMLMALITPKERFEEEEAEINAAEAAKIFVLGKPRRRLEAVPLKS